MTAYRLVAISAGPRRSSLGPVDDDTVTCDFCGTRAPGSETLTWTTSMENRRRRVFCDTCSRTHLRALEGKLDSAWW